MLGKTKKKILLNIRCPYDREKIFCLNYAETDFVEKISKSDNFILPLSQNQCTDKNKFTVNFALSDLY